MIFSQIFDMVNIGLVILDKDLRVYKWNRWMESHSGISASQITGSSIFDYYPNLNTPTFLRNCKSVLTFGNFSFLSQKLHKYFFPFKPEMPIGSNFDYMQQNCTMGPLRDEDNAIKYIFISVQDVTEIVAYESKLLDMSTKDGLTEIYNRRYFEGRLKEEFERHKRFKRTFSLVMIDIDFFKQINDLFGHQCGDFVLKSVVGRIVSNIRKIDILARYGGEEFSCLFLETNSAGALVAAEKIRKIVSEEKYEFENYSMDVTISLGVAELSESKKYASPDLLVKKADEALYEAKRTGRNKVVFKE